MDTKIIIFSGFRDFARVEALFFFPMLLPMLLKEKTVGILYPFASKCRVTGE